MKKWCWIVGLILLVACQQNRLDVDVSNVKVDLKIKRYDQLVFKTDTSELVGKLMASYAEDSNFINLYFEDILRLGDLHKEGFSQYLRHFCTDTVISQVADSVLMEFHDFSGLSEAMEDGFRHLQYYFPDKTIPEIYTYVSGFNQSMIVADGFMGIGLDKYLGSNCIFYRYLGIPQYKIKNMYPLKMVPDLFYAWAFSEFPKSETSENLLSEMIYQGKLIYFTEAMCPDLPDTILMGYSAKQMDWCKQNEPKMWSYWAEHKLLYSVDRLDLQKYIIDAPFTGTFSQESPGRTGVYTGWQIVRSYMNTHPETTLEALMLNHNSQELLTQSGYFPD